MQDLPEMQIQSLRQEDPLEEEMTTHSSILAWRIPWSEEAGGLESMRLQRVTHDWAMERTHTHKAKWWQISTERLDPVKIVFCGGKSFSMPDPWEEKHLDFQHTKVSHIMLY